MEEDALGQQARRLAMAVTPVTVAQEVVVVVLVVMEEVATKVAVHVSALSAKPHQKVAPAHHSPA
jgi:hypothetical protein